MGRFNEIIGYDYIKKEFEELAFMLENRESLEEQGIHTPRGVLLYGAPDHGKKHMAKIFAAETKRRTLFFSTFTDREEEISDLLDFAGEMKDDGKYLVIIGDLHEMADDHSVIDAIRIFVEVTWDKDVFIMATTNKLGPLPDALTGTGIFYRQICVGHPSLEDSRVMTKHLLKEKGLKSEVTAEDIANIFAINSYSELDAFISNAAVHACFRSAEKSGVLSYRRRLIRDDFAKEAANINFGNLSGSEPVPENVKRSRALHEAAHVVVGEMLEPGIMGFAQILTEGNAMEGGYASRNQDLNDEINQIAISLAPHALMELGYETDCYGSNSDVERARGVAVTMVTENAMYGVDKIALSAENEAYSDKYLRRQEKAISRLLKEKKDEAKEILKDNGEFIEAVADALCDRGSILASEIRDLRDKHTKYVDDDISGKAYAEKLAEKTGIPFEAIRTGHLTDDEWELMVKATEEMQEER